jgi:hypothetical protein
MVIEQKATALRVHHEGTSAPQCFRHQHALLSLTERESRGMELDELDVGKTGSGFPREGPAIARCSRRIRRRGEQAPDSTRGKHCRRCTDLNHTVIGENPATHAAPVDLSELHARSLDPANAVGRGFAKRAHDRRPCCICSVRRARYGLSPLAGQVQASLSRPIELASKLDKLEDTLRGFGAQHGDRRRIGVTRGNSGGVLGVKVWRVPISKRSRNSALSPKR